MSDFLLFSLSEAFVLGVLCGVAGLVGFICVAIFWVFRPLRRYRARRATNPTITFPLNR